MRFLRTPIPLLVCLLAFGGCDDDPVDIDDGPFDLTFSGDATFQAAHGGDDIEVAVVTDAGVVVDSDAGTVSASADPAFSFEFDNVLAEGETYEVHYWIDSNFNGGTAGVCEDIDTDHQWSIDVNNGAAVTADVEIEEDHDPSTRSDVCDTFTS